MQDGVLGK
ncbi:hypothetical protein LEMLEM_LOCUS15221 [Lemmus lemmus]